MEVESGWVWSNCDTLRKRDLVGTVNKPDFSCRNALI